ncbi:hypothetical protein PC116_g4703 [Phytophthora cactorum]|uniref:Uncharacterized protein n=1 Tax=Phytophthora cactorum TaxID=29920 RepID=A0A8T1LJ04_9STRA|nr:hypothetical protein PC111_g4702 [Phytophthora cactorum]KAG2997721.1 hypothetical protein PC118_g1759 [Phytophthora cactorum]KAG4059106.1 hypothetical protein PC123_g5985 [Phytophthora cactorum]KAG4247542.1 hypothetical protein PC116_g4703 [Phytophthora cactorum]
MLNCRLRVNGTAAAVVLPPPAAWRRYPTEGWHARPVTTSAKLPLRRAFEAPPYNGRLAERNLKPWSTDGRLTCKHMAPHQAASSTSGS